MDYSPMSAMFYRNLCSIFLLLVSLSVALAAEAPKAVLMEDQFAFGTAIRGTTIEHEFVLKNEGSADLRIKGMRLTSPLSLASMPAVVKRGSQVSIRVQLDTSALYGPFEGQILISLNDPSLPEARLAFEGRVVFPIEVSPQPVFFVAATRGERRIVSLDIINHDQEALRIESLEHPKGRFTTKLDTVEEGRRYRLSLILNPNGPGGKKTETILLKTSSQTTPFLKIPANTYLRERVYTFPDKIDLGFLSLAHIKAQPDLLERTAQTLMVYQWGGSDFRINLRTDIPMLDMKGERGPKGDRYQATITLIGEKVQAGPIDGFIIIETNDLEFPSLTVPVTGSILEP
jgi:hypothetical protein